MSEENPQNKPELSPEALAEIQARVERYEEELVQRFAEEPSSGKPLKKAERLKKHLAERLALDEERNLEDIRREEHFNISANMVLSVVLMLAFTTWAWLAGDRLAELAAVAKVFVSTNLSWFYILLSSGFLVFLGYLSFSRFGTVVLGDPQDRPEFSDVSWYSMLFSAGMGVGLLFWGGAEPLTHFLSPPTAEPGSVRAAQQAFVLTSFHWGLHGWGIYTLCAVGVAYFGFRKRKKYLLSSSVVDLFESPRLNQALKIFSDLVATLAVIFGVAASLGLGTRQLAQGLEYVFGIPANNPTGYFMILGVVTALFIVSASTGLKKGIQILSNVNMALAVLLLLFVFLVGPKILVLKIFVETLGRYTSSLFELSFKVAPFTPAYDSWMADWTLSYFTWWIAWAPFVGIFIARISKGRTIREMILGSLLVPTLFSVLWFSVFGGNALFLEQQNPGQMGPAILEDPTVGLFAMLRHYPGYYLVSGISLVLLATFLVTSADSATFVIGMLTTEGDLDPRMGTKVFWGAMLAAVTGLLLRGGGLEPLQAAALTSALPFSLVMILMAFSVRLRLSIQVKGQRT